MAKGQFRRDSKKCAKRSLSSSGEKTGSVYQADDQEEKNPPFSRFEENGHSIEETSTDHENDITIEKKKVLCKNPTCPHIRQKGGSGCPTKIVDKPDKTITPRKKVEYQGKEIMQVVEELMEQTSILRTRLHDMINFFQTTIGACADMLQLSTEFQHSVCSCTSSQKTPGQQSPPRATAGDETSSWHTSYSIGVAGTNGDENRNQILPDAKIPSALSRISSTKSTKWEDSAFSPFKEVSQESGRLRFISQNGSTSRDKASLRSPSLRSIKQTAPESIEAVSSPPKIETRESREKSPQNSRMIKNPPPRSPDTFPEEQFRSEIFPHTSNKTLRSNHTSKHTMREADLRSDAEGINPGADEDKSLAQVTAYDKQKSHISNRSQQIEQLPPIPENMKTTPPCLCAKCSLERQMNQIVKHTSQSSALAPHTSEAHRNGYTVLGKRTSSELKHVEPATQREDDPKTPSRSKGYYSHQQSKNQLNTERSCVQPRITGHSQSNKGATATCTNDAEAALHQRPPPLGQKVSLPGAELSGNSSKAGDVAEIVSSRSKAGATADVSALEDATSNPSSNADLTRKVQQVQKEIKELREKMSLVQGCNCACHFVDHENVFTQSMSAQLLGKANEIKGLLNDLRTVCYQQVSLSGEELPDAGQQMVTQKCEKQIRRIHPEFTRTVNQVQNIEATRRRQGDVHNAKVNEALETEIDTKYKDNETPENINLKTKVEATERFENVSPKETHRQTRTLTEKTVKTPDKAFREVNTINENDITHDEGRIIKTSKKVVRTEILESEEPKERVITNIKIRRVFDNKTGKCTETVTDGDEDSNESGGRKSPKSARISFRDQRKPGGESIGTQSVRKTVSNITEDKSDGKSKSELPFQSSLMIEHKSAITGLLTNAHGFPSKSINLSEGINIDEFQPTEEASGDSISEFMSKKSYEQFETPPAKIRRTSSQLEGGSPSKHWSEMQAEEEGCTLERRPGGTSIKQTCSRVMYVAPSSDIPGIKYIGCKRSDMSKYPSYRTKVSADKRLILDSQSSKRSTRISNPSRYPSTRKNYPFTKVSDANVPENGLETITPGYPSSAGGQGDPHSPSGTPTSTQYHQGVTKTSSPLQPSFQSSPSKASKVVFRDRTNSLNRSVGGTSIEISNSGKSGKAPKLPESSSPTAEKKAGLPLTESIAEIIRKLSGNRSPKDFFVSILPEKIEMKTFRINVIDKETGNLLGHFFVDEEQFKKARDEGVFDNYLSLFVLNSLGSYSDYVKMVSANKSNLNAGTLHKIECFTRCTCSVPSNRQA